MLMMCTRLLALFSRYTRIGSLLILFILSCSVVNAQNATRHYIPPAPWQYWSDANELVITTLSKVPIDVTISKSDGTLIDKVIVSFNKPVAYRFAGDPRVNDPYPYRTVLKGAGLIIESDSEDIYVNVRNVMTDAFKLITDRRIKGNSSMVSFGDQGIGINFRLGYYRADYRGVGWKAITGISTFGPVYSVMAIYDNTVVKVNKQPMVTLMAGESYLFQDGLPAETSSKYFPDSSTESTQGSLLQASAPVVVAVGTLHDSPSTNADGVLDQIAPNPVLGTDYVIVRGEGIPDTLNRRPPNFPEQTSIIATEDNTQVTLRHFNAAGNEITSPTQQIITLDKGDSHTFHHGDAINVYSTSFIKATKKVLVLYGTGVWGEVDISTVPPLNKCAGSDTLETIRFRAHSSFDTAALKYFGFVVSDSPTDPVTINGENIETISGPRTPVGNTGYYLMKFDNNQLKNPYIITVRSKKTVAVSFTQRRNSVNEKVGTVTSMSSYFSLFNKIPKIAKVKDSACNRKVLIGEPGLAPYQWYKDDEPIPGATDERFIATENGNYSYTGSRECGVTAPSAPIYVEAGPIDAIRTSVNIAICKGATYNGHDKTGLYIDSLKSIIGCDSIVTVDLIVNEPTNTIIDTAICEGDAFKGYTKTGTYTEALITKNNCDSIVTIILTVLPKQFVTIDTSLCEGTVLTTPKTTYNKAGTYKEVYQTNIGCDSTVTINLSYRAAIRVAIDTAICFGTTYVSPKGTYSKADTYTEIYTAANKCDSIVTIRLKIDPKITSAYTKEICQGKTYSTPQQNYTTSGTFTEIYKTPKGCDSTVTFQLIVNPLKFTTVDTSICEGEKLTTPKTSYNKAGTYKEVYQSFAGCDSTVTINLAIISKGNNLEYITICEGDTYRGYTSSGTYYETRTSASGCAANFTVFLTVLPKARKTIDTTICFGTTYTSPKGSYSAPGTYTEIYTAANKCDSILIIRLKIDPKITSGYTNEICQGDSYSTPQKTYTTAGTFTEIYKTSKGCDSTVTFQLIVNPLKFTTVDTSLCEGQTLKTPQAFYSEAGTYKEVYKSFKGCDSTVTIKLTFRKIARQTIDKVICEGETFEGYSKAGTYTNKFTAKNGCDSIRTLNLSVIEKGNNLEYKTICEGESYRGYTASGTYNETRTSSSGCAANYTVFLTVLPKARKTIDTSICFGTAYTSPKGTYSAAGTYTEIYTAANKCDSVLTIRLKVDPKITATYTKEICQGDSYTTPQKTYTTAGNFTEIYKTSKGCDSTVTFQLIVNPLKFTTIDTSLCEGQLLTTPKTTYNKAGIYKEVYKSITGCDSTVTISLSYRIIPRVTLDTSLCFGTAYISPKGSYSAAGTYTEIYTAANKCDSIVTINIKIDPKVTFNYTKEICLGETYSTPQKKYTTAGTFTEIYKTSKGCDSTVTFQLIVNPLKVTTVDTSLCEGQQLITPQNIYNKAGTYKEVYKTKKGCDSTVTINLSYRNVIQVIIDTSLCFGTTYTTPKRTYTVAGTYTEIYNAANKCDSIVIIRLNIDPKITSSYSKEICKGTTFSTPQKNYTTAGTFTEIYKTLKGCDSTVIINLIVKPTFETNLNKTICEGDNFKGYTTSGSYKESYTAINGCDSTVNIYLTVLKKSYVTFNRSVCQGDNFRGFTTTGTFVETFTAANGCDSIVTTRLTVLSRDTVYESKTICEGESYRGFTQSGNYTVPFFNQNNCESIIYVNLNVLKKSYLKITQSICEGESFRGYTLSGIYTEKYLAANGCDSIVTIDLHVIQKQNRTIRVDICEGSSHRGYTKTGIYKETFTAVTGCDSIVTTILTVRPHTRSEIYRTICEGQQLDGYNETGTYTDTLINRWGCDSVRVLHLTVEKKSFQFFEGTICQGEQYLLPNGKRVSNAGIYVDTVRTRFGCDSLIRTTTITLKPGPVFTVSKSNDINCVIGQAQLTVTGGVRYLWSPSSTLDSANSATPIASPKETTTYKVRVWGRNGCSFTKDITVYADFNGDGPRYPIPSAFTPNKDGLNDCFNVRHWGPVQNFKMDIFNRWGEKVFSTTNIQSCWDGTINKMPLPSGVFIYKISANGPCGNMFRTGQVTLIR